MTRNQMISSTIRAIGPPPVVVLSLVPTSLTRAKGRRATIPIIMIREIPLPMPLSVILSPSHITNIEPDIKMMVATRLYINLLQPSWVSARNAAPGIWLWMEAMYAGPWMQRMRMVRYLVS